MATEQEVSDALLAAIPTLVAQPKSATVDGVNVTQQDLSALIAAHKYFATAAATKSKMSGIRFSKIVAGGASGAARNSTTSFERNV